MEEEIEIWKDIKDFEGLYQVSTWGRVKSLNYKHTGKEGIMKNSKANKPGHLHVILCKNGTSNVMYIHRMVATAFIPNPENKPYIDHIDGNPLNNFYLNLRWCTQEENCNNPISRKRQSESHTGLFAGENHPLFGKHHSEETKKKMSESHKGLFVGENHTLFGKCHSEETKIKIGKTKKSKPVICLKDNQIIKIYDLLQDVKKDGFNAGHVSQCCQGKEKHHHGYNWMYLSEYKKMFGQLN